LTSLFDSHGATVVAAPLTVSTARRHALEATLAAEERERAARLASDELRRRFVVARGLLRERLGALLGVAPGAVAIGYGRHGKPRVAGPLRFNVAHSGELVLVATAWEREVGVDVERVRRLSDPAGLAAAVLAPEEQEALAALPEHERGLALLRAWTAKEAYLKARGNGLSVDPRDVVVDPPDAAAVPGERVAGYIVRRLAPGDGYVAAFALEAEAA
jgi:4'-phosphopantetheinyl transferase